MLDNERAFERIEAIAERLERVMYGDSVAHQPGLLTQVENLRDDMQSVRAEVQAVRTDIQAVRTKSSPWLLLLGYTTFLISGLFAMTAFYSLPEVRALLAVPAPVAVALAAVFALATALLVAGGLGLLSRGP